MSKLKIQEGTRVGGYNWTEWKPFPDPRNNGYLYAPFGPGVYQLRNKVTEKYVLFGESKNVAFRMSSLLPFPVGKGTRKNPKKRDYVIKNIGDIEYRTLACITKEQALEIQRELRYSYVHKFKK